MNLTDTEKKCIILAMNEGAASGEIEAAAAKFVLLLRKRYVDGYALLKDLEVLPDRGSVTVAERQAAWQRRRDVYGSTMFPFGKHKGKTLSQIPADYLLWILKNVDHLSDPLRSAIENFLDTKAPASAAYW
jgi:hypothetical protein